MNPHDLDPDHVWRFFCVVSTRESKSILAVPSLMNIVLQHLNTSITEHNSQLWGYVILPDSVQFIVEVPTEHTYHVLAEHFKDKSESALIAAIVGQDLALEDAITYYNPAWARPIHLVWQNGYQTQLLSSLYAMSNKIADLVNRPVTLGLVQHPADWAFSSYRSEDETL